MVLSKNLSILQNKSLKLLLISRISTVIASQMLTIAVGWQIYSLTEDPFYLGLVGLMQFLPMFLLTLIVGHVADRYDRRRIISISEIMGSIGVFVLALGSYNGLITKERILIVIFFIGITNAFQGPSMQALVPNIVDKKDFPKAAALVASATQFAVIIGPGLGGVLYSFGPMVVYSIAGTLALLTCILINFISVKTEQSKAEPATIKSLFAGISFIKRKPIILGAISLDLFAVLFGGATALLPVYASQILIIGPFGLGLLRSAPAVGALLISIILARKPLSRNVGKTMFVSVIFFGLSTIVFAISTSFILSMAVLFLLGATDMISVVIRSTLVQMETPDNMRGRVSSVNSMFIGTSNQLGEFESGLTASLFGIVPAVLIGGIGTIAVVLLWMKLFPDILHIDKFQHKKAVDE
jgi:MFS family permease